MTNIFKKEVRFRRKIYLKPSLVLEDTYKPTCLGTFYTSYNSE